MDLDTASSRSFHALLADALTGQVTLIAGRVLLPAGRGKSYYKPRLWLWQPATSSWNRVVLSTGSLNEANVRQVSRDSLVVGSVYSGSTVQAAIWQPNGSGGWTLTTLGAASAAYGINRAGTIIVGASAGVAAYWTRSGSAWTGPVALPAGCTAAEAVDDAGRIAADGCSTGTAAVVFVPPYANSTAIHLGGLGKSNGAFVESMSPSGDWIVGQSAGVGVYWRPF